MTFYPLPSFHYSLSPGSTHGPQHPRLLLHSPDRRTMAAGRSLPSSQPYHHRRMRPCLGGDYTMVCAMPPTTFALPSPHHLPAVQNLLPTLPDSLPVDIVLCLYTPHPLPQPFLITCRLPACSSAVYTHTHILLHITLVVWCVLLTGWVCDFLWHYPSCATADQGQTACRPFPYLEEEEELDLVSQLVDLLSPRNRAGPCPTATGGVDLCLPIPSETSHALLPPPHPMPHALSA